MSRHNLGEKNMPSWLFVLILFTNAILFLVPHWLQEKNMINIIIDGIDEIINTDDNVEEKKYV